MANMSPSDVVGLFGVKGLVAVITGGGTGIGLMMAKGLEENGAKVYILGRRMEKFGNIIPIQCDVSRKEELFRVAQHVEREDGFINCLIANSGIGGPLSIGLSSDLTLSEAQEYMWAADEAEFTKCLKINTAAVYYSVVVFLKLLDAGNKKKNVEQLSQVIATSSIAGLNRQVFAGYAYAASKAATNHLMKAFATMLAPYQIRSNVIVPGPYPSEMTGPIEDLKDEHGLLPKSFIPLQRMGTQSDMSGTILFMTSRAGAFLNGNMILTDGGRLSIGAPTY